MSARSKMAKRSLVTYSFVDILSCRMLSKSECFSFLLNSPRLPLRYISSRFILFPIPFILRFVDMKTVSRGIEWGGRQKEREEKGRRREKKRGPDPHFSLPWPKISPQSSTFDQTLLYCHLIYLFYLSHSIFLSSYASSLEFIPPQGRRTQKEKILTNNSPPPSQPVHP